MSTSRRFDNFHPGTGRTPAHVGLIPDGTRRWARRHRVSLPEAYGVTVQKLAECLRFFFEHGTRTVSLYLASTQNFRRGDDEVQAFCRAGEVFCSQLLPPLACEFDARVRLAGRGELLPPFVRDALDGVQRSTASNDGGRIYLCAAYNPLEEVAAALAASPHPEEFVAHLWVPEPVDLVIRTSGVALLSNFLPLQSGYARLHVLRRLFNDVTPDDLQRVYDRFARAKRRYGE